jgi:hypothetical protein
MKLNLTFSTATLLSLLRRYGRPLAGLALVAVFGYTGWVINQAFNVKPTAAVPTASPSAPVVFDKKAIETVKSLRVVPGDVAPGDLGKSDPFGN